MFTKFSIFLVLSSLFLSSFSKLNEILQNGSPMPIDFKDFKELIKTKPGLNLITTKLCNILPMRMFYLDGNKYLLERSQNVRYLKDTQMGHVFLYKDELSNMIRFVKEINIELNHDHLEAILREINFGFTVNYMNKKILHDDVKYLLPAQSCIFDDTKDHRSFFIFYPYYSNGAMMEFIRNNREEFSLISFTWRIDFMLKIAKSVKLLADSNIGHRDIKPDNIMISDNFDPILIDFGSAKPLNEVTGDLKTITGTPRYMAPEVVFQQYGLKADVFSLGLVFFEILNHVGFESKSDLRHQIPKFCEKIYPNSFLISHWEHNSYCNNFSSLINNMANLKVEERCNIEQVIKELKELLPIAQTIDEKRTLEMKSMSLYQLLEEEEKNPLEAKFLKKFFIWKFIPKKHFI